MSLVCLSRTTKMKASTIGKALAPIRRMASLWMTCRTNRDFSKFSVRRKCEDCSNFPMWLFKEVYFLFAAEIKRDVKFLLYVLGRRNLTYQRDQSLRTLKLKQNQVSPTLNSVQRLLKLLNLTQTIRAIILARKL